MKIKEVLETKNWILNPIILKTVSRLALNLNEFLFLIYYLNYPNEIFDINQIAPILGLSTETVLATLDSLIKQKLVKIKTKKNSHGKSSEYIYLDDFYLEIEKDYQTQQTDLKKTSIFQVFEAEFGRPISSMEYEIIKAWLEHEFTEELILGALKEAVYNGITNLRYIDKILYEWHKKGFRDMKDVNNYLRQTPKDNPNDNLFDYNWLDDDK